MYAPTSVAYCYDRICQKGSERSKAERMNLPPKAVYHNTQPSTNPTDLTMWYRPFKE